MDQEVFLGRLHGCVSAKQVFKLLASLETMSDTVAALALQRIAVLEHDQNGLKNPEAVLENDVFKALCFQFEHDSQRLTDAGLVTALHACTQLYVDPWSTLMVRLVSESQERLDRGPMAIKNLCILGEALLALEGPGCGMLKQVMDQVQEQGVEKWSPEEVTMVYNMLQAGVGESGQYQDLLNTLNSFTISIAPKLNPKSISHILNALVVLNQTQAIPLVISLCKHSVRHVPRFSDEELVLLLGAFMHFGQSDRYFIEALERYVPKSTFTMNPEAVSKVMQYCSRRQILSRPIFDSVAQSFVYRADTLSTSQIARQIMPFGKLYYLPPNAGGLFRRVEGILRDRFSQFQPRTLLNLLHSCTLIERFPVNFVAKVFSPYFLQQLEAQGTGLDRIVLAQLTQLFMTVKLECPFYECSWYSVHTVLGAHCYRASARAHGAARYSVHVLLRYSVRTVHMVLGAHCTTLPLERTVLHDAHGDRLIATVSVHERMVLHGTWIAVCIDGQKRFCANSHNFLGKEAIKKRHLKLLGYEVVQIPFYEFEKLNDRNDTVEYLHKKIFPHSYRLSW
ncbi:FAST kinase domain-containing protein 3 [Acipenser ruthenus]|uniref:FAST kinase domain-containing protein 3 n=1 Tax=Acipenser ruthenus TaxID=7906 RepID=A0A444U012_ACIRT|nr:FAST kinase domain-containing protein 3 [Acipenser ruthenus]